MMSNKYWLTIIIFFTTAYSYGDSAGFTPDFPFNDTPEGYQPISVANVTADGEDWIR